MKQLMKFNLFIFKDILKLIFFDIILMILFLVICNFNKMINNDIFFKITGSYLPINNILDISMFLIINASFVYITVYLLAYDFKKTEVFLRIKNLKTWFLAKLYSLLIFNVIFICTTIIVVEMMFIILNQMVFNLSINMILILFIKNVIISFIVVFLFYVRGGKNGCSYQKSNKKAR